jgi:hypothetical protein
MFRTRISNVIFVAFYVIRKLRWEVIVSFVDIGGIVDHHCLYFLFYNLLFSAYHILMTYTSGLTYKIFFGFGVAFNYQEHMITHGSTSWAGTSYPSGSPEFTPSFIVLSVLLRYTDSDCPFDIFVAFYVTRKLRWEEIVSFVDIGGIVDHHCLYFLFYNLLFSAYHILMTYTSW